MIPTLPLRRARGSAMLSLALCLGFPLWVHSATYYVDSSSAGNDGNAGTSQSAPWKSMAKVNLHNFQAGDQIQFKRGLVFFGTLTPPSNGTAANPITFGAYGTGARPVLTDMETLSNWTLVSAGIYEADLNAGTGGINMVTLNGVPQRRGRWPNFSQSNEGYLVVDSHTANSGYATSITSQAFQPPANFSGAEIVTKNNIFTINRNPITSISGTTIHFTSPNPLGMDDGNGFFIQNHPATLDVQGEWYYNPSTHKLRMYFGATSPASVTVKAVTSDYIVSFAYRQYIMLENLTIQGSKLAGLNYYFTDHITVSNCRVEFAGTDGSYSDHANNLTYDHCAFENNLSSGITQRWQNDYLTVTNCTFNNTALIAGGALSGNSKGDALEIYNTDHLTVTDNVVTNSGAAGIMFDGANVLVQHNYVYNSMLVITDMGGIYSWSGYNKLNRRILDNVVVNSMGSFAGTTASGPTGACGIYLDDRSANVEIKGNTIKFASRCGIYLHNNDGGVSVVNNVVYDSPELFNITDDGLEEDFHPPDNSPPDRMSGLVMNGNIFVAINSNQKIYAWSAIANDIINWANVGGINNNYWVRTGGMTNAVQIYASGGGGFTLDSFKAAYSSKFDQNTIGMTPSTAPLLVYNETASPSVVSLGGSYTDVYGTLYTGTITLAPYKSAVLFLAAGPANPPSNLTSGLAYSYYDLTGTTPTVIPNYSALTPKSKGIVPTFSLTPATQGNYFGFRYDGLINVPADGTYTFYLFSDDGSKIWIDGVQVLSHDGLHYAYELSSSGVLLTAGLHTVRVDYLEETGSEALTVSWSSPALAKQEIPASSLFSIPANTTQGLSYKYYDLTGTTPTLLPDLGTLVAASRGTVPTVTLSPATQQDYFAFRFEGTISLPADGAYTFYLTSDDGSKLWIDGTLAVSNDGTHGPIEVASTATQLTAGLHSIRIDYFEAAEGQSLSFSWAGPGIAKQVVSADRLFTPTSWARWQNDYFTTSEQGNAAFSGATADLESDGISNQLEYAFGGDPRVGDLNTLPSYSIMNVSGTDYGALTFRRRPAATDITYDIQVSGDLVDWTSINSASNMVGSPTPLNSAIEQVTVRDIVAASGVKRFMRLRVIKP